MNSSDEATRLAAAEALRKVPTGEPLGTELFDEIALHTVSFSVEACALRRTPNGFLEVYLVQRAPDDTAYPGQYHCPGTFRRPKESRWDTISRLAKSKFQCEVEKLRHVGDLPTHGFRGTIICEVHLVDLAGAVEAGWYTGNIYGAVSGAHKNNRYITENFLRNLENQFRRPIPESQHSSSLGLGFSLGF